MLAPNGSRLWDGTKQGEGRVAVPKCCQTGARKFCMRDRRGSGKSSHSLWPLCTCGSGNQNVNRVHTADPQSCRRSCGAEAEAVQGGSGKQHGFLSALYSGPPCFSESCFADVACSAGTHESVAGACTITAGGVSTVSSTNKVFSRELYRNWSLMQAEQLQQLARQKNLAVDFVMLNKLAIAHAPWFEEAKQAMCANARQLHAQSPVDQSTRMTAAPQNATGEPCGRLPSAHVQAEQHDDVVLSDHPMSSCKQRGGSMPPKSPQSLQRPRTAPSWSQSASQAPTARPWTAHCQVHKAANHVAEIERTRARPGSGGSPTSSYASLLSTTCFLACLCTAVLQCIGNRYRLEPHGFELPSTLLRHGLLYTQSNALLQ